MTKISAEVPQPRPEEPDPWAKLYEEDADGSDRPLGQMNAEHFTPEMGEYARRLGSTATDATIEKATGIAHRGESETIHLPGGSRRSGKNKFFGLSNGGRRRKP